MAALNHAEFGQTRRFAGLDGLRAVAILAVIWHHSPHSLEATLARRGFLGVDLFFVLSGFLIATLLLREKRAYGRISLKDFWARRFLRLMPAYYLMLAAVAAAYLLAKPGSPEAQSIVSGMPVYALYLSNWIDPEAPFLGPTWSLATEEQFYLIWPLVEASAGPAGIAGAWIAGLGLNQAINFGLLDGAILSVSGLAPAGHPEILHTTFTPILLGVGLAHALAHKETFNMARRIAGFPLAGAVWALLALSASAFPAADISGAHRLVIHLTMTALIAAVALQPAAAATMTLEWRPLRHVGVVSYGMYLYHLFAIEAARKAAAMAGAAEGPLVFFVGTLATVAIATASFYLLERRFLALRDRFRAGARPH
jgi:peptidoglycan/LPS O-acetylase OafA/YrhL